VASERRLRIVRGRALLDAPAPDARAGPVVASDESRSASAICRRHLELIVPGQTAMIDTPFTTGLELDPARIITSSPA